MGSHETRGVCLCRVECGGRSEQYGEERGVSVIEASEGRGGQESVGGIARTGEDRQSSARIVRDAVETDTGKRQEVCSLNREAKWLSVFFALKDGPGSLPSTAPSTRI